MRRLFAPLLFFCAVSALAEGPAVSLSALVDAAWQRDPQARGLDARRAELAALTDVAAGLTPSPGSVGISNRSDRLLDDRGRLEWELEYAQPVWLPGQAGARRDEAAAALRSLDAERLPPCAASTPSGWRCAWASPAASPMPVGPGCWPAACRVWPNAALPLPASRPTTWHAR